MKTIITTLTLIAALSLQSFAVIIPEDAEGYVDDIPFSTSDIYIDQVIPPIHEAEVNDIPFNTELIAARAAIPVANEENVDDIPFNTSLVAARACICEEEEAYVNDIPFDTQLIAARELIPVEEEKNAPDQLSLAFAPFEQALPYIENLNPVLNIQIILGELEGMVFELSQLADQIRMGEDLNHDELILELNRVVTEDMMNIFGEQTLFKNF